MGYPRGALSPVHIITNDPYHYDSFDAGSLILAMEAAVRQLQSTVDAISSVRSYGDVGARQKALTTNLPSSQPLPAVLAYIHHHLARLTPLNPSLPSLDMYIPTLHHGCHLLNPQS